MRNSAALLKMVRKCRLTNMINKHEQRELKNSRIFQIRQQMLQDQKTDSDTLIK